jgi:hypothetical protein
MPTQHDCTAIRALGRPLTTIMFERASPGPYLELFGRRSAPGWTVWGNQIERTTFDPQRAA